MQFPRLVYKGPATHKLVQNAEEHSEAIKGGWFSTVPEALGHKPAQVAAEAPKAEDLGQSVQAAPPTPEPVAAPVAPIATPAVPVASGKKAKKGQTAAPVAPVAAAPADGTPGQKAPWD